jgi:hypothetical protein
MILELNDYVLVFSIPSAYILWKTFLEIRFFINLTKQIHGYSMYKNGPNDDRLFLGEMETLCLKAREGVNRNYKSNIISLEQSMEIKAEIDELRDNSRHGPRGRMKKLGYLTRRKLSKLDDLAINTMTAMISDLESKNNQNLTSNCSKLIKETNDALTRRTHLVANTGD